MKSIKEPVKLSILSYTMFRQPEYFDLEKMIELTKELNMDGIDFVGLHNMEPGQLRKMTDDYGIPVVCYTFRPDLNHDSIEGRKQLSNYENNNYGRDV